MGKAPVSAKGLFKATGKKRRPVARQIGQNEYVMDDAGLEREADDFYPTTPPEPGEAIIWAEQPRLRQLGMIWEPAVGDGALLAQLQGNGFYTFASDLVQRGAAEVVKDWYAFAEPPAGVRAALTNPPWAECHKDPGWIRHGMQTLGLEYMALLLPLNWLGAINRAKLWEQYPPARIYVMRWRVDFTGQGGSPMITCWVVWDRAYKGETLIRMLDRKSVSEPELFQG